MFCLALARVRHRTVPGLLLIALLVFSFSVAAERVTLQFQYRNAPGVVAAWIEEFEALYPHIDVEWEVRPGGDWQSLLITQMIANTAPDVFEFWGAFGQDLARRGLLLDLRLTSSGTSPKRRSPTFTRW